MSSDPALVVRFLSQNDVACPGCGYSLRGCAQPSCPECGDELSLALRGDSSNVLVRALRYLLWAIAANSLIMIVWWIWTSISSYSLGVQGGLIGFTWYLHMGINAVLEVSVGVLCFLGLHRLKHIKASGQYRAVAKLVCWVAILEVANLLVGTAMSFAY